MFTANYHTHTTRCRHANGADREYVECAVNAGLTTLGFSDHTPQFFRGDYYSSFRMYREEMEEYFASLLALKAEYKDRIDIKIGFEAEYYPTIFDDLLKALENYPCDYIILGQHFLGNEYDEGEVAPRGTLAYITKYVDQVCEAMRTGCYTYFAHPDLHVYPDDAVAYGKEMERLIACAIDTGTPLEINCLGIRTKRCYPHEPFWKLVGEMGAEVVIGSDAHTPTLVFDAEAIETAESLIEKYHLRRTEPVLRRPVR